MRRGIIFTNWFFCGVLLLPFLLGTGGAQDSELQAYFARQRKAAEAGNPTDQYNFGVRYLKGEGVERNEQLAIQWIRAAVTNRNKEFVLSPILRREAEERLKLLEKRASPTKAG